MWRKIGIVIGGVVILQITWFCSITIPFIIVARFFETTELVKLRHIIPLFVVVLLFLFCWLVGRWVGKKIGEKGWLYGGLPSLVFAVIAFFRLRVWKIYYLEDEPLISSIIGFCIIPAILILLGVAGGVRGERAAKRRKARI
ncbi:hypothetical protein L6386_04340 [bacterium]|nr:hypothetical protein [bacterium]MBU4561689.1 hypothetical protein [bacterium]MCG2675627.1 hypothetical protein [bacterium]MCG2677767.1 hypothetical protein [bacterium]